MQLQCPDSSTVQSLGTRDDFGTQKQYGTAVTPRFLLLGIFLATAISACGGRPGALPASAEDADYPQRIALPRTVITPAG